MAMTCCNIVQAQVTNIGKIVSYKKITGGITGKAESAIFEVRAYSDNVVRVRVSKEKSFHNFSYALVNNEVPDFKAAVSEKDNNTIRISTKYMNVEIVKKHSFRVVFKNVNGVVLNEDVSGSCFGTTFIGDKVSVYKTMQEGERFVGVGEALGPLDRAGTGITLNNTDTYKYGDPRLSMYASVPFYIGLHHGEQYGIFYNNSFRSFLNFGLSTPGITSMNMDGGDADYFFMYDSSVAKVIEHYTSLTGRIQLPPLWGIGYHQSRCSYYPQEKVEWIASTFRQKKIPLDCIVLDADYQQGYQPFRVNKQRFPDMAALAASLAKQNIELTASVYPGVAIDTTYHSYVDGMEKNVFVRYANGRLFNTEIAPVKCYIPDYTKPAARAWWKEKMKWLPENGIHGYWNDMNEPALGGSYLPDNLLFDFDGRKANALEAKNVYGFQMARSSYEAALQNSPARRPFILTRSGFAGVQRYSAVWSGDNTASDEGLMSSVLLNNQMGLSGIAFCGHDIGGFIGDGSKDLYKRWIEVGVFSPFCRNHKGCGGIAGEPWAYDDEAEAISKAFIGFRYRLIPYLYSSFYEAAKTGMPIARSLCINYPHDDKVYDNNYQQQFLFGSNLLIAPVTSTERNKRVYLPAGGWFDIYSDEVHTGPKEMITEAPIYQVPVFAKASSIIAMQSLVQSVKEKPSDTMDLHIFYGKEKSSYLLYEDEGEGFGYREGKYSLRQVQYLPVAGQIIFQKQEGNWSSKFKRIRLILHGFDKSITQIKVQGNAQQVSAVNNNLLFDPLAALADVYDAGYYAMLRSAMVKAAQQTVVISNDAAEIKVEW